MRKEVDPMAVDIFQSTSSARRTTVNCLKYVSTVSISIHVLREEDDP